MTRRLTPLALWALLVIGGLLAGCGKPAPSLDPDLTRFTKAKQAQARALVAQQNVNMPAEGWRLFDAVLADDFTRATNLFARLERRRFAGTTAPGPFQRALDGVQAWLQKAGVLKARTPVWGSAAWQPLAETHWAYVLSKTWHKPWRDLFGDQVLAAVPAGRIYFGGTHAGRFLVSARCASHVQGRPFFVLTQNALVDVTYLDYLRSMFSNRIYVPTPGDSQQAFQTYLTDAQRRAQVGQLKKDENVQVSGGRVTVSGRGAVMEINALLVKVIFDNNPGRDLYVEQSWPLDWTYPHLLPQGPVLKINREPLRQLPEDVVQADRRFWSRCCAKLIGDWIKAETTSVSEVCDFAERTFLKHDLNGFGGEPDYVGDAAAQAVFAKLRLGTADLYRWRCAQTAVPQEKQRMGSESLLAYQQAFALGPGNPEVALEFAAALAQGNRPDEAVRILQLSAMLNPTDTTLKMKLDELRRPSAK